jgi:peptide methionine sulfoxide reductase msrA/msrB
MKKEDKTTKKKGKIKKEDEVKKKDFKIKDENTSNIKNKNNKDNNSNFRKIKLHELTEEEERVILRRGTEIPYTGEYENHFDEGIYLCKQCGAMLYLSKAKFDAKCGWPSFDEEIPGAVLKVPDSDGHRTEIICANCKGHLGHVFTGERFTSKNTRHCVNSISLKFIPEEKVEYGRAIYAGGCFWGVEYHMMRKRGVVQATSGYTGGIKENPTYKEVCRGETGHVEAVEVLYDPLITNFEELTKLFFEIHNPEQKDGQGPDIGEQYLSYIFYTNEAQMRIALKLIAELELKGYKIATKLKRAGTFYKAEEHHQNYYEKKKGTPYCHVYTKRF